MIDPYLSQTNRDNPGDSCPVAAFAGEIGDEASDSPLQQTFINGLEESLLLLSATQAAGTSESDRRAAMAQYAMMVGALTLARATKGNSLSDEFLNAARNALITEKNPD